MDGPSIIDDEIVADSEGEEEFMQGQQGVITNGSLTTSRVSEFTEHPKQTHVERTVSSFIPHNAKDSSIVNTSSSSARPRPRPRPAYRGALGYHNQPDSPIPNNSIHVSERAIPKLPPRNDDDGFPAFIVPSIADRAKMRQRDTQKSKPAKPPIEVIDFSSDDDDDEDELALTSSKKTQKSKAKAKAKVSSSKTPPKVRAKSKSKNKKKNGVLSPLPREESPQPSLPMGTSPVLPRIELATAPPSTLPPSDPPSTLFNVNHMNEKENEHPPITVLVPHLQSDVGSSSQATSPCPSTKRKRSSDQDELEYEDVDIHMVMPNVSSPAEASPPRKVKKAKSKKVEDGMTKGKGKKKTKDKDKRKTKAKEPKDHGEDAFTSPRGLSETAGNSNDKDDVPSPPPREKQKPNENSSRLDDGKNSSAKPKRRRKAVISEDEDGKVDEEDVLTTRNDGSDKPGKVHNQTELESPPHPAEKTVEAPKENVDPKPTTIIETPRKPAQQAYTSISSRYTIAPRTKSTPMCELIRRVNAQPNSPFPRSPSSTVGGTAYSPYLKSSRSMLSRIAPLHPNRRTPPPPLPPPPPKKKSKKELEMEERWEEELVESVGGITEWAVLSDQERRDMRRAKRERELYGCED